MSDSKIILTFQDEDGNSMVEHVWATKEGEYYRIKNIPFFAINIAYNDLVSVEDDDGRLYYDDLIEASGHSTIQMIIFPDIDPMSIGKQLEEFGCSWEGSHLKSYISIDIPKEINYQEVKKFLAKGEEEEIWSYKEACLAHTTTKPFGEP